MVFLTTNFDMRQALALKVCQKYFIVTFYSYKRAFHQSICDAVRLSWSNLGSSGHLYLNMNFLNHWVPSVTLLIIAISTRLLIWRAHKNLIMLFTKRDSWTLFSVKPSVSFFFYHFLYFMQGSWLSPDSKRSKLK